MMPRPMTPTVPLFFLAAIETPSRENSAAD
jgi:hypothetical protein